MTYSDMLVVDSVAHAYDLSEENFRHQLGKQLSEAIWERTQNVYNKDGYKPTRDQYIGQTRADELEGLYFEETDVDFVTYHAVGIDGWFHNGLSPLKEGIKLKENNPNRVAVYGHVDPLDRDALEQMEYQSEELDVDGFKFYPASYRNEQYHEIALNDPKTGLPMLKKAKELGVTNVGVHKVLPLETTPKRMVGLDDVDEVATMFPDINFEIVHAGYSFLEDALFLISRHPNVYANLESTHGLIYHSPREFAKIMARMVKWAGPEKLLFATGSLSHPQPVIEDFWDFQIPEDLRSEYNVPKLSDEEKEQILGLNALEVLGKDPEELRKNTEGKPAIPSNKETQDPWDSFNLKVAN